MDQVSQKRSAPDTITTEVIARRFIAAAEEMFVTLVRSAYSPNIRERRDCSVAIFDSAGRLIALSAIGPIHLSALMGVVENIRRRFDDSAISAGDCFITNDPYSGGGSHLPDITLISPVFREGNIVAFVANLAHHSDVGGRVPGSESADCTDIFQEGLRIPLVRLVRAGVLQPDIFAFLALNSRRPKDRDGDINAQLASIRTGVQRVQAIHAKFSQAFVAAAIEAILNHAAARTRAAIRAIPNGRYENTDYLDNDGVSDRMVSLAVALIVEDERIVFDFTGTSPQVAGARNMPLNACLAGVYYAVKALLDPDLPANWGTYSCVDVIAPAGTVFNAVPPAAVGDRAATGNILGDLIFGAMAKADPTRVMAGCGPYQGVIVSGKDPRTREYFVDYETFAGASGATCRRDGHDAVRVHVSGSANLPIESLEHEYPIIVDCYELIEDSGGAGAHRGGMGTRRDITFLGDEVTISGRGLRQTQGATGLFGGGDGGTGRFVLQPASPTPSRLEASFSAVAVKKGDQLRIETPSGAGYGEPLTRDVEGVLADIRDGRITPEQAQRQYGVSTIDGVIDAARTRELRGQAS
ncbi:MAG: hydantoinase B/oxoprolinase family protein [Betaproteobacteria bacterium]